LIDTYTVEGRDVVALFASVMDILLDRSDAGAPLDDAHLIALGAYLRLSDGWAPEPPGVPSLLIRAREPLPSHSRDAWDLPDDTVEVAGDHFTVIDEHVAETAAALREWLSAISNDPAAGIEAPLASAKGG
jgi:polyketide synthase 7